MNPLAIFFTLPVKVKRYRGSGPYGDAFHPETEVKGRVRQENQLVVDASGQEVVAKATVSLPIETPEIPAKSLVQLPGSTEWRQVIGDSRHVGGFNQSPDYYSLTVK